MSIKKSTSIWQEEDHCCDCSWVNADLNLLQSSEVAADKDMQCVIFIRVKCAPISVWFLCGWRVFSEPSLQELAPPHPSASAWLLQIVIVCSSDLCSPPASLFSSLSLNLGIFLLCVFLILPCSGRMSFTLCCFSRGRSPIFSMHD